MTDLKALAERIEAGSAEQQRELLEEAWRGINGAPHGIASSDRRHASYARLCDLLDVEAYESAAMMLLADERLLCLMDMSDGTWTAKLWKQPACGATTPAMALAAAAIRARITNNAGYIKFINCTSDGITFRGPFVLLMLPLVAYYVVLIIGICLAEVCVAAIWLISKVGMVGYKLGRRNGFQMPEMEG